MFCDSKFMRRIDYKSMLLSSERSLIFISTFNFYIILFYTFQIEVGGLIEIGTM